MGHLTYRRQKTDLPKRKRNRLENFDYGNIGCYFVTLCTQNRQRLFEIEPDNAVIVGNDLCVVPHDDLCVVLHDDLCVVLHDDLCAVPCLQNGILKKWIIETENKFQNVSFEKYVIMPDHLHFIIKIKERHTGRSLQDIMQFFKTMTTNDYIRCVKKNELPRFRGGLWQKSYYDHIIRNQKDYNGIWEYIENNPEKEQ